MRWISGSYRNKFETWITAWGDLFDAIIKILTFCIIMPTIGFFLTFYFSGKKIKRRREELKKINKK